MLVRRVVVATAFAEARVLVGELARQALRRHVGLAAQCLHARVGQHDLLGIGQTESQRIAMNQDFHRIAHRRILYHLHFRAGNYPHVEQALTESAVATHRGDKRPASDW